MTLQATPERAGVLADSERQAAIKEFAAQLPGKHSPEECMALHIKEVDQVITYKPHGVVMIHTHVIGKRKVDDVTRFQKWATISSYSNQLSFED